MGAPKGSKNAKAYHVSQTKTRVAQIGAILKTVVNSGFTFSNVTALSKYVGEKIGTSAVTLRRNEAYRAMLETHLVKQRGATSILTDRDRQIAILKSKLKVAELEASNAKADKKRLEAALQRVAQDSSLKEPEAQKELSSSAAASNEDFECTALIALALLERIDGFEVDEVREVIIDRAAKPGQEIVAGPNQCRPFIKWVKKGRANISS